MNNEEIKTDTKRAKDLIRKGIQLVQIARQCSMTLGEVITLRVTVK